MDIIKLTKEIESNYRVIKLSKILLLHILIADFITLLFEETNVIIGIFVALFCILAHALYGGIIAIDSELIYLVSTYEKNNEEYDIYLRIIKRNLSLALFYSIINLILSGVFYWELFLFNKTVLSAIVAIILIIISSTMFLLNFNILKEINNK